MSWASRFIDGVVSVEPFHISGSITGIGLTHVVDDIVLHVFVLMDVSVISGVTVGELLRVFGWLVGRVIDLLSRLEGGVTSSWRSLSLLKLDEVTHVDLLRSLDPLVDESAVVNNWIIWVKLVFDLLIIGFVSVGNMISIVVVQR